MGSVTTASKLAKSLGLGMNEFAWGGAAVAVAIGTPFIPSNMLAVLDLFIIRVLVVLTLLWTVTQGAVAGVAGLVIVGVLYMERNRRKVVMATQRFVKMTEEMEPREEYATVEQEGVSQKTVFVREFDIPEDKTMYYMPVTGCVANSNDFAPLAPGESLDTKRPLPSIPIGAKSAGLFQTAGFGRMSNVVL
jgi:hypothetical protein